ncbi:MAG TPA: zinc-binding dehydrogenase, partial [Planctomycetaceae bacterium]|nr:zinc-binding dehydrogenase [Planctomycetaceae bacterium]
AMFNASPDEQRQASGDINHWLAKGKIVTPIGKRFSLAEAAAAHRLQEENTLGKSGTLSGKIVLTP